MKNWNVAERYFDGTPCAYTHPDRRHRVIIWSGGKWAIVESDDVPVRSPTARLRLFKSATAAIKAAEQMTA